VCGVGVVGNLNVTRKNIYVHKEIESEGGKGTKRVKLLLKCIEIK